MNYLLSTTFAELHTLIYPDNFEVKLGFDKIKQLILNATLCPLGAQRVNDMKFSADESHIITRLAETDEMMQILSDSNVDLPTDAFIDMTDNLRRLRIHGTFLEPEELLALRRSLGTVAALVRFFNPQHEEGKKIYKHLQELSQDILSFPDLTAAIDSILVPDCAEIRDNATPQLAEIRRALKVTMGSISRLLSNILRTAQNDGWVEQGVTPTMRDGRLVIPISPSHKRRLKGIVHDESATGKTVYVEPSEVVDANNRIRELEGEERQEIIRILTQIADRIRPQLRDIAAAYDFMGQIDFIRAKAKVALRIGATVPTVETRQHITDWVEARHPLLYLRYKAEGKEQQVVPLDIKMGDFEETKTTANGEKHRKKVRQRIILISGPNAGGKSVCLETVGLLQYMLQCGVPIPVRENSRCTLYEHIFAGIGDEQNLDSDLSTYSSHLLGMKYFLRHANRRTLLLIDEFGSGTEPQIGGAIAQALLGKFNEARAHGVITTHFQNLKQYAEETPGIANAAMLYDRAHLAPLFKLEIGHAGSSFALEIAYKIGLPPEVIDHAKEIAGSDYVNMDKFLQNIARDKRYWEQKRERIHQQEKTLDQLQSRLEEQSADLKQRRQTVINDAKQEASQLLRDANARIERTIKEIKEAQAEREATREIRRRLKDFSEQLATTEDDNKIPTPKTLFKKRGAKNGKNTNTTPTEQTQQPQPKELKPGDSVRLKGQQTIGEVIAVGNKDCVVAFGMLKSTVAKERLEPISKRQAKKEQQEQGFAHLAGGIRSAAVSDEMRQRRLHFKSEIDVRGMRADEALQAVTYFIDDAILLSVGEVRILHGTGTGALRVAIRQYLSTINGIANFHDEHVQFGGAGITVVELD